MFLSRDTNQQEPYYLTKILSPFLSTAPLQYVPKILFTQATIDCLTNNKTKTALHKETVILSYIGGTQLAIAWVINHL